MAGQKIDTYSFSLVNAILWISVGEVKNVASPPFPTVNVRIILKKKTEIINFYLIQYVSTKFYRVFWLQTNYYFLYIIGAFHNWNFGKFKNSSFYSGS